MIVTTILYSNTSELRTSTIHRDIEVVNSLRENGEDLDPPDLLDEAYSIARTLNTNNYGEAHFFTLANGTNGGRVSVPYPTPYIVVDSIVSHKVIGDCSGCQIVIASAMYEGANFVNTTRGWACLTTIGAYSLKSQYIQAVAGLDFATPDEYGTINNVSFSSWIMVSQKR